MEKTNQKGKLVFLEYNFPTHELPTLAARFATSKGVTLSIS